jgi:hypothetical protein
VSELIGGGVGAAMATERRTVPQSEKPVLRGMFIAAIAGGSQVLWVLLEYGRQCGGHVYRNMR